MREDGGDKDVEGALKQSDKQCIKHNTEMSYIYIYYVSLYNVVIKHP